jgi:hypothetical protein
MKNGGSEEPPFWNVISLKRSDRTPAAGQTETDQAKAEHGKHPGFGHGCGRRRLKCITPVAEKFTEFERRADIGPGNVLRRVSRQGPHGRGCAAAGRYHALIGRCLGAVFPAKKKLLPVIAALPS